MSETIVGTLDAVTEKGDWTTFEINVGSQYPVRLSTKVPELIELGRAARGQPMEWTFNAVEGNVNPKSGKPYINRYFEGVAPVGTNGPQTAPAATGAPAPTASQPAVDWDAKERRDYRSRAWAQTISALSHTIKVDESAGDIYRRLYALQRMIYRDIVRDLDPETFPDDDVPFG